MKKVFMSLVLLFAGVSAMAGNAVVVGSHSSHGRHHHHNHMRPQGQFCAIAYNSYDSRCTSPLFIKSRAQVTDFGRIPQHMCPYGGYANWNNWDNKIVRVDVAPGCTFVGYQYQDFNVDYNSGYPLNGFTKVIPNVRGHHTEVTYLDYTAYKISSFQCHCR